MKFKVEVQINDKIVRGVYFAEDLEQLEKQIKAEFPRGRIVTIIGG